MKSLQIGYFPYRPVVNPYQRLFAGCLERVGVSVKRIPPRKSCPLQFAASHDVDLLQLDWPHDWYQGRNIWTRGLKRLMYLDGLRRLRKIPVVWTAHNLVAHDAPDARYEHRMIQELINVCDGIIVLSQASRELLRREYLVPASTLVEVVHHGHYIGCYPNSVTREAARQRLGITAETRVVVSVGRLQPYKGLEELVQAFAGMAQTGDVLLLAGKTVDPNYAAQLQQTIAGLRRPGLRVELHDRVVPDEELQVYFNACDVVALPFRHVLNSGSLLLAMSFGCPVVAPRLGSIPEVACPEGWFGFDSSTSSGLSVALGTALATPNLMRVRGRILDFTTTQYDWRTVGAKVTALYAAVLDRAAQRPIRLARH